MKLICCTYLNLNYQNKDFIFSLNQFDSSFCYLEKRYHYFQLSILILIHFLAKESINIFYVALSLDFKEIIHFS